LPYLVRTSEGDKRGPVQKKKGKTRGLGEKEGGNRCSSLREETPVSFFVKTKKQKLKKGGEV